jgi:hypothetical protein
MMVDFTDPVFHDEAKALPLLEASAWRAGAFCPHRGSIKVHQMAGKTQSAVFLCDSCRDKFTARVGSMMLHGCSMMKRSHIFVHRWLLAMHLTASRRRGSARVSCSARWGSPTNLRGSYRSEFARPCAPKASCPRQVRQGSRQARPAGLSRTRMGVCHRQPIHNGLCALNS